MGNKKSKDSTMCYIAKCIAEVISQFENQQNWMMYKGMPCAQPPATYLQANQNNY